MQTIHRLFRQFVPENYGLTLELNGARKQFRGTAKITGILPKPSDSVRLHGKGLRVVSARVGRSKATVEVNTALDEIILHTKSPHSGKVTLRIEFEGDITDVLLGIYPCRYTWGGVKKELLATQFESHFARQAFPCIDEPEAKATFDLTLVTERGVKALSNMPAKSSRPTGTDKQTTRFYTTPRMSSYLLAFVVGELECSQAKTASGVDIRVWSTPAHPPKHREFALQTAIRALEFFEDYFETPYPLPKLDNVALPDFDAGAMENWGLITYREAYLTANPTDLTQAIREYTVQVICHEISHQWFGNLVTMKWWNELWLNESFASAMQYIATHRLFPEWSLDIQHITHEGSLAMARDSLASVQPIHVKINHPDEINTIFDPAIVYAKGSRLISMLINLLGENAFRRGLAKYFRQHAYGNTASDDLWQALSSASGQDVASIMTPWLKQSGFPVVRVGSDGLSQKPYLGSNKSWPIPIAPGTILESPRQDFNIAVNPVNPGARGYFVTHYEESPMVESMLSGPLTPAERYMLLHDAWLLARGGHIPLTGALEILPHYQNIADNNVWDATAKVIETMFSFAKSAPEVQPQVDRFVGNFIGPQLDRLGYAEVGDEPTGDISLRSYVVGLGISTERPDVLAAMTAAYQSTPLLEIPANLRAGSMRSVLTTDESAVFASLLDRHNQAADPNLRIQIAQALCQSTRDSANIAALLDAMNDTEKVRTQDTFRWVLWLLANHHSTAATWKWIQANWDWLSNNLGRHSYAKIVRYIGESLGTPEQLAEFDEFFEPKRQDPALNHEVQLAREQIVNKIDWIQRDMSNLQDFLSSQSN